MSKSQSLSSLTLVREIYDSLKMFLIYSDAGIEYAEYGRLYLWFPDTSPG